MLRYLLAGVLIVPALGQTPVPQDNPAVNPRFQVATIKPSTPEESRTTQIRGNRFATTDTSIVDLIKYAYGLHDEEIAGGPKWLATQKFDLMCDPETATRPSSDQFKKMVQDLLADRFHMATHRETRELSVFAIVPAKAGPKLHTTTSPPDGPPVVGYAPGQLAVGNATMADFAKFLQRFVTDRPVLDETGIAGKYDLTLRWTPDDSQPGASRQAEDNSGSLPGFFTAIQEQLGLKLQEEKHPAEVLVIDHIEMPSEN
jgi:uncharacterized protein (TIGR03435 family)